MAEVLLERDAQLEVLVGAVAEGAQGRGSTALIAGEAGIGKTSLVRALAGRVGGEARVLMAACDDLVASRTLGPLHDAAVGSDGPLAAALADDEPGRSRLRRAAGGARRGAARPSSSSRTSTGPTTPPSTCSATRRAASRRSARCWS